MPNLVDAYTWNITDASFAGFRFHVAIPDRNNQFGIMSHDITNERRLQVSEKAQVDGAEVEDFGRKARMFNAEVIFYGLDYTDNLRKFESILNSGKSGTLILPDLEEAVKAKYQKHTRKSNHTDGNSTILSVSWIEDTTAKATNKLRSKIDGQNLFKKDPTEVVPEVAKNTKSILDKIKDARNSLANNRFLTQLQNIQSSVTSAKQAINSVTNIPKNLRNQILQTKSDMLSALSTLEQATKGLQIFTDLLDLSASQPAPLRVISLTGVSDFREPDIAVATVVAGNSQVVTTPVAAPLKIQSFPEATKHLDDGVKAIAKGKATFEVKAKGQTSEFSTSAVALINEIKDLMTIIDTRSTKQVLTVTQMSLLEICFQNGLSVSDVDRVYKLNTFLSDPLDVPAMSVISL